MCYYFLVKKEISKKILPGINKFLINSLLLAKVYTGIVIRLIKFIYAEKHVD
ncbi:MAG: hypothetical protein JWM20_346 [Patescibacteria group bacterium]|nr:hypothetical protein [Patescibacteria group bacterium]